MNAWIIFRSFNYLKVRYKPAQAFKNSMLVQFNCWHFSKVRELLHLEHVWIGQFFNEIIYQDFLGIKSLFFLPTRHLSKIIYLKMTWCLWWITGIIWTTIVFRVFKCWYSMRKHIGWWMWGIKQPLQIFINGFLISVLL